MNDQKTTIGEIRAYIARFMGERNWTDNHKPDRLAMSMSIEAAELMEYYQWGAKSKPHTKDDLASELADIVIYALTYANIVEIDVAAAIDKKMQEIAVKYPVSVFNANNNSLDEYWAIKKQHRGKK